jgi:glutamate dehydrogenase (NAD(P)+)
MSARVLRYTDPIEGFRGWLVYDGTDHQIAAGGCRIQPGLTEAMLAELASRMTLKQRILGLCVDGAKCGIDYDPRSPGRDAALRRFVRFLRDELRDRFSMGCDMGTRFDELERFARAEGVPSVKYAIKGAQGLSDDEFFARLRLLDEPIGMMTLSQRRAGHALAHMVMAIARAAGFQRKVTCALQGFGNLGRAAAYSLVEENARVVAIADEFGCVADERGLNVPAMLATPYGTPVPATVAQTRHLPSRIVAEIPCDVLVLAAGEDAIDPAQTGSVAAPVVVVGANCGLRPLAEADLHRRGTLVIPDFIGGIGGSGSIEAIFGTRERPTGKEVLDLVAGMMQALAADLTDRARRADVSVRRVANEMAARSSVAGDRPYGHSPYLIAQTTRRVNPS